MPKKEKTKILITLGVFLVLLGIFFLISDISFKKTSPLSIPHFTNKTNNKTNKVIETVLEVNGVKYESKINGIISVYNFMEQLQKEGKISFKYKTYSGMGKLIEEINGIKSKGNKYWIYYVNGKKANIGVSNYEIKAGDIVSWKYKQTNFI